METPEEITTPPGWSPRRIRRFMVTGAIIGALVGLLFAVIKVAAVDDWDFGENWLWLLAIVVGGFGGAVIGLVAAGVGHSEQGV